MCNETDTYTVRGTDSTGNEVCTKTYKRYYPAVACARKMEKKGLNATVTNNSDGNQFFPFPPGYPNN